MGDFQADCEERLRRLKREEEEASSSRTEDNIDIGNSEELEDTPVALEPLSPGTPPREVKGSPVRPLISIKFGARRSEGFQQEMKKAEMLPHGTPDFFSPGSLGTPPRLSPGTPPRPPPSFDLRPPAITVPTSINSFPTHLSAVPLYPLLSLPPTSPLPHPQPPPSLDVRPSPIAVTPSSIKTLSTDSSRLPARPPRTCSPHVFTRAHLPPPRPSSSDNNSVPYLGPMSQYLIPKPPPPEFSRYHQGSIISFLKYCAPISEWSTLSSDKQRDFKSEPQQYGPDSEQVLRCSLDGQKAGKPGSSTGSYEPKRGHKHFYWTAMDAVVNWIWEGSPRDRWCQVRFIMEDLSGDITGILRLYADQYRFRRSVQFAWADLYHFLTSLRQTDLTPHLRRARLLVEHLNFRKTISKDSCEYVCDLFFSDENNVIRDQPWLEWFKDLDLPDKVVEDRLHEWKREECLRRKRRSREK